MCSQLGNLETFLVAFAQWAHWWQPDALSALPEKQLECLSWVGDDPPVVTPDDPPAFIKAAQILPVAAPGSKHCRAERQCSDPRERLLSKGF